MCLCICVFFFFKQKTAYEMRISDWSSDVCSSDLQARARLQDRQRPVSPPLGDVAVVHHLGRRPWAAVQRALLPALPPEGRPRPSSDLGRRLGGVHVPAPQHSAAERCRARRSEEHTSELQSLMRISYAVFCL